MTETKQNTQLFCEYYEQWGQHVQEIIQHLNAVDGATVELKLEVEVIAPNGIPSGTVRTVSENCRTLKGTDFGFDD